MIYEDLDSDSDVNDVTHKKLLGAVSRLYKKRRVEKPKRTEPWHSVSEYHVGAGESQAVTTVKKVSVEALAKNLPHNLDVLKSIHRTSDTPTLPLPIEKIYQDRVKRSVGYNNVRHEVAKWDPVIRNSRLKDQLKFPLAKPPPASTFQPLQFLTTFTKPNELELKLAEALGESPVAQSDQQTEKVLFKLSLKEIIEKRKLLTRIKAQESYKMLKQMKRNKIKSKSYRRLRRREKQKEELKVFEELKNSDPESALICLNRMEKARVKERANLRHMNTGKWAKGKAIRAKYNRQARAELAVQLAKSRELRQKRPEPESESDEESEEGDRDVDDEEMEGEGVQDPNEDPRNPWMKTSDETVEGFVAGFKEFSARQNPCPGFEITADPPVQEPPLAANSSKNDSSSEEHSNSESNNSDNESTTDSSISSEQNPEQELSSNELLVVASEKSDDISPASPDICDIPIEIGSKKLKRRVEKIVTPSGIWHVTDASISDHAYKESMDAQTPREVFKHVESTGDAPSPAGLEEMFHNAESILDESMKCRLKNFTEEDTESSEKSKTQESSEEEEEEETETNATREPDETLPQKDSVEELAETAGLNEQKEEEVSRDIDPNQFMEVKQRYLTTQPAESNAVADSLDDPLLEQQALRTNLEQAFTNDEVFDKFTEEKAEESNKAQMGNIELGLPGWGHWAGSGMGPSDPSKHMLITAPPVKRKDDNMKKLILRDDVPQAVRQHQVSTLPFPFTSVKEYEASVRAPLGSTWLPSTAHQVLTKPPVITKMGTIIQPMDADQILMLNNTELNDHPHLSTYH